MLKLISQGYTEMAQGKKAGSKIEKPQFGVFSLCLVAIFALVALGVLSVEYTKRADEISKYELLEKIDNQACRYLNGQPSVNGSFDLNVSAPKGQPKLTYTCLNGDTVASRDIQGKFVEGYNYGATVSYFSTNAEAEKYAEIQLNPMRYWGVDTVGQDQGIPQTSKFTFIVNDEKVPYFDAYTVKANAVLRVSLPCGDPDVASGGVACYAQAQAVLDNELKGINVL